MREIKFRAWCSGIKKFLFFDNVIGIADGEDRYGMFLPSRTGRMYLGEMQLSQYIGIKDKNGVDVYESDFVRTTTGDIILIRWANTGFMPFRSQDGGESYKKQTNWDSVRRGEIIGNIYEPELIKESEA